ncbi:uncharacterized protein LOC126596760 [Malus sylvestris]|uniref:uncharacterized protein LOC126596760 n=1 Tax=Malus sylvestris TaxID=3752 RepID=UPI0021AC0A23|nr:uncharacterized protein LOC126596760 [Malus sylvestris]
MSSWKLIEDVTLCECWVHTTHDPITGNEMDKREMWSKITKAFCDVHGENARTSQGLQGRWKKLNASFTCWKNAISHASGNLRSGTSLADQTLQAQAFYNSKNGNKSFNRLECWQIVKDCPKYKIVATGPEVVMHGMGLHSSPEPDMAEQEADTFQDTEGTAEQLENGNLGDSERTGILDSQQRKDQVEVAVENTPEKSLSVGLERILKKVVVHVDLIEEMAGRTQVM